MQSLLDSVRNIDFNLYLYLHRTGVEYAYLEKFYYIMSRYGIIIIILSFIYLIWNKKINALICSFFALALAGFVDLIIFLLWKRPRPFVVHADVVNPETSNFNLDMASFPSNHTYIAFAIAISVFLYGHKKLGAFLIVIATFVAVSRIGSGLHYPSDVIGGALLGIASGIAAYLIVHKLEKYWN